MNPGKKLGVRDTVTWCQDDTVTSYLQVFRIPGKNWFVLLSPDNQWGFEHEGKFLPFATPSSCMPLLPMLDRPHSEMADLIKAKLHETGRGDKLIETFPFDFLIQCALTQETSYWPMLAVQWLENGYPLSESILVDLKHIPDNKRYSQNLRHRTKHLIKKHTVAGYL
jgi:hypothetical protein